MNRDDIDLMWQRALRDAIKSGGKFARYDFAAQVVAAEREACAKVCDALPFLTAEQCATAIRMRGEAK